MVHSFDIFDTVVTRRLASPHDVFALLAERLRAEGIRTPSPLRFAWLRIRAERWAARFVAKRSVKLEHIYRILGILLGWSRHIRQQAMILERELEASLLVATPSGLEAVQASRNLGHTVAFICDMYLDSRFLDRLLQREGLKQEGEILMVSCEHGSSKAAGDIWPMFLDKAGITADKCFHRGDNLHGDLASPQKHGIAAKRLGTAEVSRWEQWQERRSPLPVEKWGSIAAMSRMTRVGCEEPDDYWTQLGTGLLGPVLLSFAQWLLAQAKKDGVQTLWFLSRDGWLFYQAAKIMNRDADLRLQYVGVNRLQLRFAQDGSRPLEDLLSGSRKITWELLSERLRFSEAELLDLQKAVGVSASSDDRLSQALQEKVLSVLTQLEWQQLRDRKAYQTGETVKAYLAECLAQVQGALGVVDIGWAGRTQDGLKQFCAPLTHGYYLGLSGQKPHASTKRAWLFDANAKEGAVSLNDFQRMIEVLVGGVSGPLVEYRQVGDSWQPQFATVEKGEHAPGREIIHEAAIEFVKQCNQPEWSTWWSAETMESFACWNLRELLEQPTIRDAKKFQEWQITTDDAHQDTIEPAKGFDFARIAACLNGEQAWAWLWPQASLRNSPPLCRAVMKAAWKLRRSRQK